MDSLNRDLQLSSYLVHSSNSTDSIPMEMSHPKSLAITPALVFISHEKRVSEELKRIVE
jgi:hypothetical protein